MRNVRKLVLLAAMTLVVTAPFAAGAQTPGSSASTPAAQQRFADGDDWTKASLEEKRAFLFGIANAISVAIGWDERHVPADQATFSRRAREGLAGTSLGDALNRIDAWYAANPSRLETPVVAVMWLDIAKPKLQGRK